MAALHGEQAATVISCVVQGLNFFLLVPTFPQKPALTTGNLLSLITAERLKLVSTEAM